MDVAKTTSNVVANHGATTDASEDARADRRMAHSFRATDSVWTNHINPGKRKKHTVTKDLTVRNP